MKPEAAPAYLQTGPWPSPFDDKKKTNIPVRMDFNFVQTVLKSGLTSGASAQQSCMQEVT